MSAPFLSLLCRLSPSYRELARRAAAYDPDPRWRDRALAQVVVDRCVDAIRVKHPEAVATLKNEAEHIIELPEWVYGGGGLE